MNPASQVVTQLMPAVWVFGGFGLFYLLHRQNTKRKLHIYDLIHKERLAAMDKGLPYPELPPYREEEAAPTREPRPWNPRWPLGAGIIGVLGGAGTCLAMMLSGEQFHRDHWSFGLIPIFLGVGLWLHYWVTRPPRS